MEKYPKDKLSQEAYSSDSFLESLGATQASTDRDEKLKLIRLELAASKGIDVTELTAEDLARTIQQVPLQADMAIDELFGAGFYDYMKDTRE